MLGRLLSDLLVGVPAVITRSVLEGLRSEVDRERLVTEESVRERLQQLQVILDAGDISEQDYERIEEKLIARLRAIREIAKGT